MQFRYDTGAVVFFSGRLLQHGVLEVEGDRIALAYYMRDMIHDQLGVKLPDWPTIPRLSYITLL